MSVSTIWKQGYEIELMASPRKSRKDLAEKIALRIGGNVRPTFYPQSEKWKKGLHSVVETLTQGFLISDRSGRAFGLVVDDITLCKNLNKDAAESPGWYRILSCNKHNIEIARRLCDPEASLENCLKPVAMHLHVPILLGESGLPNQGVKPLAQFAKQIAGGYKPF